MRAAVVLSLMLLPGVPAKAVDLPVLVPRPSTLIDGDAAFHDPLSGVRSGSGTPEDPFHISGWHVFATAEHGILLANTSAHVIIEDLRVEAAVARPWTYVNCMEPPCSARGGIHIERASNVTIRETEVFAPDFGVRLVDASDVSVARLRIGVLVPDDLKSTSGIWAERVRGLTVSGAVFDEVSHPMRMEDVEHVRISDSLFRSPVRESPWRPLWGIYEGSGRDIIIERNRFEEARFSVWANVTSLQVRDNAFVGAQSGFEKATFAYSTVLDGARFCGNLFEGAEDFQGVLKIWSARNVTVDGNEFRSNLIGLYSTSTSGLTFNGNIFHDSGRIGAQVFAPGFVARNNSFERNPFAIWGSGERAGDARWNWWNAPTGPSLDGTGPGEYLRAANTTFEPWLTERPTTERGCAPFSPS